MRHPRFLRFGLLAVFAAMLTLISVAGWLRSELDLYRDEQAIVAAFAEAGCTTYVFRGKLDLPTAVRRQQEGYAWYEPEWLTRMTALQVGGEPPQSLLRRAAALPTLQSLKAVPKDPTKTLPFPKAPLPPPKFPPTAELLDRTLPEFREAAIEDAAVNAPLPDGEAIEGAERDATLQRIREAWTSDSPKLPARFVKRTETLDPIFHPGSVSVDLVRDGDAYWNLQRSGMTVHDESRLLTLRNAEGEYGLVFEDSRWILARQADANVDSLWAQQLALRNSKNELPRLNLYPRFPDLAILDHVARLARIDEDRVRLAVR